MSSESKQLEEIVSKLSTLDKNHNEVCAEFRVLQRDNICLQKDVLQIQKENVSLKKRIDCMEEREVKLDEENARLRRVVNSLKNETDELKDQLSQVHDLRRVFSRSLVAAHGSHDDIESDVKALAQRTKDIEEKLVHDLQCTTYVELGLGKPLVLGQRLKLDRCTKMVKNGGSFDVASSCLNPQVDGTYGLNAVFRQIGDGKLRVFAKIQNSSELYLGKTTSGSDISSTMRAWKLKKGQKVSFEIILESGNASLRWFNLYTWLF